MKQALQKISRVLHVSFTLFLFLGAMLFTTGATAQTITDFPWTETFNADSPTRDSWTQIYEVNNMSWTYTQDPTTGSYNLDPYDGDFANYPGTSHDFDTTKLVSPILDLTGMSNVTLNFVYVNPFWSPDQNWLTIYYRTSAASPWVQLQQYHSDITTWTPSGVINLPNPTATYQIAIECETDYGYSTLVDQVVIDGTTSSIVVTAVDVTTQGNVPATITTTGGTLQLNATVAPAEASQAVTWSVVSGSSSASVSATGLVTAIANGTVTIRATSVADPTKYDDIEVTINMPVAVTGVEIATVGGADAEITTEGGTLPLMATVLPSGANQDVTWSVSAGSAYGSVSASGVVTAISNGVVTVRATSVSDPSKFDEFDVLVNVPVAVTGVTVTTEGGVPATIEEDGGTLQLEATVAPAEADQDVTWSITSGSEFGSVDADGTVTAIANGTITIRATSVADPTQFDEIVVTVAVVIEVESVEITTAGNVAAVIDTPGGSLQLLATVNPDGADQAITWSITSGSEYATLNDAGLVTALANGTVTVRATSDADNTIFDEMDVVITNQTMGTEGFTANNIRLYPNPTTGILNIGAQYTVRAVEVYNMLGQLALTKNVAGDSSIDMTSFPTGHYIVKVSTDNGSKSFKVVKE